MNCARVGLILTTRNLLTRTMASLASLEWSLTTPVDMVVSDNGSSDGTPDVLEQLGYEVIRHSPMVSISVSLNRGIRTLSERGLEYIGWVHNDMRFPAGWLEPLMDLADSLGVGKAIASNIVGIDPHSCDEEAKRFLQSHGGRTAPGNGCPWLMRTEVINKVGLFDEEYEGGGGYEDWDYNNRILEMGYQILITGSSVVRHETMATRKNMDESAASRRNASRYRSIWKTDRPLV